MKQASVSSAVPGGGARRGRMAAQNGMVPPQMAEEARKRAPFGAVADFHMAVASDKHFLVKLVFAAP